MFYAKDVFKDFLQNSKQFNHNAHVLKRTCGKSKLQINLPDLFLSATDPDCLNFFISSKTDFLAGAGLLYFLSNSLHT